MSDSGAPVTESVDEVRAWLTGARRVVGLTGPGIQLPTAGWNWADPVVPDLERYRRDPEVRATCWRRVRQLMAARPEPGEAHLALARLDRTGRLTALVTQNTDGRHRVAGGSPERVLELHGTVAAVQCLSCGHRQTTESVLVGIDAGDTDPRCPHCGGLLKVATVSAGQALDPDVLVSAVTAVQDSDLLLVVGAALGVQPAVSLVEISVRAGARVVLVTRDGPALAGMTAAVLRGEPGTVLTALVGGLTSVDLADPGDGQQDGDGQGEGPPLH